MRLPKACFRVDRGFLRLGLTMLAAGAVLAPPAAAAGRVSLSWNGCSPIVSALSSDGAHAYSAYVSVTGQADPHMAYSWQAFLTREGAPAGYPDAWRFDPAGCQGSTLVRIDHTPGVLQAPACPAFQGAAASLQIKDFSFDALNSRARVQLGNAYPAGVAVVEPNVRYFLGRVEFEHAYSAVGSGTPGAEPGSPALTCGGFEADMRLSLVPGRVTWRDLQGVDRTFEIENPSVTFCGSCSPTPAASSTWGAIKGHYRR